MEKETSQKKTQWEKKKFIKTLTNLLKTLSLVREIRNEKEFHFYSKPILHDFLLKKTKEQTTIIANT